MAKASQGQPKLNNRAEYEKWYDENIALYESLAKSVAQTVRDLLEANSIDFVDIKYRGKTKESFLEKIERKKYIDFEKEMTDLAGVRVIVLLESDIKKVSALMPVAFSVHDDDSGDKSKELGLDRVGYRSVHFVCDIGGSREGLPEFLRFKDKCFEVQVRTVLQNTWADIAHARSYKLKGKLPDDLSRRLNLLSGMLELVDLELSAISSGIENYKQEINSISKNELINQPLDSVTLIAYLSEKYPELGFSEQDSGNYFAFSNMEEFGLKSLADLDSVIDPDCVSIFKEEGVGLGSNKLLVFINIMLISFDLEKFFRDWTSSNQKYIPESLRPMLEKIFKIKGKDLKEEMMRNGVDWLDV